MKEELAKREDMMRAGGVADDGQQESDQWRVYQHIIGRLRSNEPLRLMIQASAGTGKSFLLTTVFLFCIVHKKVTKAAAPTGAHSFPNIESFSFAR